MNSLRKASGLLITPSMITFDSAGEDASTLITMQNAGDQSVRYKFRTPPSQVVVVSEPLGHLTAGSKTETELSYRSSRNEAGQANISIQVKYLSTTEDDGTETTDLFRKHKDIVQTAYLAITFKDQMDLEDKLYMTPLAMKWWKK